MVVILKTDANIGTYSIIKATHIARATCTKIAVNMCIRMRVYV